MAIIFLVMILIEVNRLHFNSLGRRTVPSNLFQCKVSIFYDSDRVYSHKIDSESVIIPHKRKVDLIEEGGIKNPLFKVAVDSKKRLIYG